MKSWQDVLRENTFNDESFQLEADNDAYIVSTVLDSYGGAVSDYTATKPILDAAYQAGYKLAQRANGDEIHYVLSKEFGSACIIFEFASDMKHLLKGYVTIGNGDNKYNQAAKIVTQFSQIYDRYDFKRPLEELEVNLRLSPVADPAIYVGQRKDFVTYFKFMYLFMKTMITKLKSTDDVKPQNAVVDNFIKVEENGVNDAYEKLVDQFTSMIVKIKDKYNIALNITSEFDNLGQEYKIAINWVDGYMDAPPEVQEKLIKAINILSSEVQKLNGKFDQITVKSFDRFIKTLIIKYV
jgi:hypothetical protein